MTEHAYIDPPGMPEDERMTDAELKVVREFLGVTGDWLADHLGVSPRTVRHWEQGKYPIPDGVRLTIENLEATAAQQVSAAIELLNDAPDAAMAIPRTEADCPPECPWPPSWHRAVAARIAQEVPGLSIVYSDQT
ncbi:helix-turn-helix domain-containing protein [Nonomuraea sp. CA-218870]|uniref:helix-turn-helix domain-containing protein n=1 Tax=Nonomuraea sp. CA-218870 TaxID=3239998 RepID=UPI003D8ACE4D